MLDRVAAPAAADAAASATGSGRRRHRRSPFPCGPVVRRSLPRPPQEHGVRAGARDRLFRGLPAAELLHLTRCAELLSDLSHLLSAASCLPLHLRRRSLATPAADVKYLQSGLRSRLLETITKHSAHLGRDAVYKKECKVSRLPAFLSTQFVRFQYKERASTNAKILKDIKFPVSLDVFELCTPELQEQLLPARAKFKEAEDRAVEAATATASSAPPPATADQEGGLEPCWFPDDVGSNNSGFYQLQAVLTHKGRSSSSGHYLAWIKGKAGQWFKCDDEDVAPVAEEDILKLSGGGQCLTDQPVLMPCCLLTGDWHTAYVLLYGPRLLSGATAEQASAAAKHGKGD